MAKPDLRPCQLGTAGQEPNQLRTFDDQVGFVESERNARAIRGQLEGVDLLEDGALGRKPKRAAQLRCDDQGAIGGPDGAEAVIHLHRDPSLG